MKKIIISICSFFVCLAICAQNTQDLTYRLKNPDFSDSNGAGWTQNLQSYNLTWSGGITAFPVAESYHSMFYISQELTDMPDGIYVLTMNGFCDFYDQPSSAVEVYLNDFSTQLKNIKDDVTPFDQARDGFNCYLTNGDNSGALLSNPLFIGSTHKSPYDGVDASSDSGYYPGSMEGASVAFSAGRYLNKVYGIVSGGKLTVGVRNMSSASIWVAWGNMKLEYMKNKDADIINASTATYIEKASSYLSANKQKMTTPMVNDVTQALNNLKAASTTDSKYVCLLKMTEVMRLAQDNVDAVSTFLERKEALLKVVNEYSFADLTPYNDIKENINNYTTLATSQLLNLVEKINSAISKIASTDNPIDYTGYIYNPTYDNNTDGWTVSFSSVVNSGFQGAYYNKGDVVLSNFAEGWNLGNPLGDGSICQNVSNLPDGIYTLEIDAVATNQNAIEDYKLETSGFYLYVSENGIETSDSISTYNAVPEHFALNFLKGEASSKLEIGVKAKSATGNWLAVDNWTLTYYGGTNNTIAKLSKLYNEATDYLTNVMTKDNGYPYNVLQYAIEEAKKASSLEEKKQVYETLYSAYAEAREYIETQRAQIAAGVSSMSEVVSSQYFTTSGTPLSSPQKGVMILRQTRADGSTVTSKVFTK